MSKCIGITDSYLTPIIESCKQLETLNIAECPDLSDASLDLLPSYLRSSLVSLNISGCLGFTPEVYFSLLFDIDNNVFIDNNNNNRAWKQHYLNSLA